MTHFDNSHEIDVGHLETSGNVCLASELASWAGKCNIRQNALAELLQILRKYHSLPKDARTAVKTVRSTDIRMMRGLDNYEGEYAYFGIEKELNNRLQNDFPV